MAQFKPAKYDESMAKVDVKGVKPPVDIPTSANDKPTFEWCEKLRKYHADQGEYLTLKGLLNYAENSGIAADQIEDLQKQVKSFYKSDKPEKKSEDKSPAPETKEKTVKTSEKAAPKKNGNGGKNGKPEKAAKSAKAEAKVNPGKKPAKNGKPEKKAAKKPAAPKAEGKVLYEGTVKGLPVVVSQQPSGTAKVTVAGETLRGLMKYMGWKKVDREAAYNAAMSLVGKAKCKFGKYKNAEEYVNQIIADGNLYKGVKDGCFGPAPDLPKDVAKAVLALAK